VLSARNSSKAFKRDARVTTSESTLSFLLFSLRILLRHQFYYDHKCNFFSQTWDGVASFLKFSQVLTGQLIYKCKIFSFHFSTQNQTFWSIGAYRRKVILIMNDDMFIICIVFVVK
jgi:hypothetical protein